MTETDGHFFKLGSASSKIRKAGKEFIKAHRISSLDEAQAISKAIALLSSANEEVLEPPLRIKTVSINSSWGLISELEYTQRELSPWIEAMHISGFQLYALALLVLKVETLLLSQGLTFVDARPSNFWLGIFPGRLVDLASIKPYSRVAYASFRADFIRHFVRPLALERSLRIPVSSYFRGAVSAFSRYIYECINPMLYPHLWMLLAKEACSECVSEKIAANQSLYLSLASSRQAAKSSKRLISYSNKEIISLSRIISRLSPSESQKSAWLSYGVVHNCDYTQRKQELISTFARKQAAETLVVDLGSNLTTVNIPGISVRIDHDHDIANSLRKRTSPSDIVLHLDIAKAMCNPGSADFKVLNLFGAARAASAMSIMHHLVIDAGLPVLALYSGFARLYDTILLEFPISSDPMIRMLMDKKAELIDWDWDTIHLPVLSKWFRVEAEHELSATRRAFVLRRLFECNPHE